MNFNIGGPSNYEIGNSSSYSSSSDSEDETIQRIIHNNNTIMELCLAQLNNQRTHGGSVPGHVVINRNREAADRNLFNDYFLENPRYNAEMFRRRFRMSQPLFLRIVDAVKSHDNYFQQRCDGLGRLGLSTLQKITVVFRMLAYGVPADATDEYVKIGESTAIQSLKRFFRAIVELFAEQYLRTPTANDIARLLYIGEHRGFPGMLGSLDCMHWKWKNCPTSWAGQYRGRHESSTIILETVADYDLWIWHAYFGMPGTNNDINVLESSHLLSNMAQGITPPTYYIIQGREYNMGYYLADSIYPKLSTIVQTIHEPRGQKKSILR